MSSIDWMPDLAAALDRLVPLEDSSRADWGDVVGRVHPRRRLQLRSRRQHRGLRLAIVVAVILLLLAGVATATYLLARGNGGIALGGGRKLVVVEPNAPKLEHVVARCSGDFCAIGEPAFSPNGRRLAFIRGFVRGPMEPAHFSLFVAAASGHGARRLAGCGSCGFFSGGYLGWSPDGKWIAFARDQRHDESLWIVSAAGGRPHRLTDCNAPGCADSQPAWSPDGQRIVFVRGARSASGLYTIRRDGSDLTKIGKASAYGYAQWSPDGRRIVFDAGPDNIATVDADGSRLHMLLAGPRGSGPGAPSWSPGGQKILYFDTPRLGPHKGYLAEVWTMNADGSDKQRLYRSGCCVGSWAPPIWSPDGRLIVFSADSAGGTFVINADGTGLRRLSSGVYDSLAWQPLRKGER
jgi:WD40-like Beta Propeller Repeat